MSERRESLQFGFQRYWLSKKTHLAREDIFAKNRVDKKQQAELGIPI